MSYKKENYWWIWITLCLHVFGRDGTIIYEVEQEVTSVSSVQFIIRGSSAYLLDKKMFSHILILLAFLGIK